MVICQYFAAAGICTQPFRGWPIWCHLIFCLSVINNITFLQRTTIVLSKTWKRLKVIDTKSVNARTTPVNTSSHQTRLHSLISTGKTNSTWINDSYLTLPSTCNNWNDGFSKRVLISICHQQDSLPNTRHTQLNNFLDCNGLLIAS